MSAHPLRRVRAAARARDAAQKRFEDALRAAIGAGASTRAVAEAAGLTHTRVGQIVGPVGALRDGKRIGTAELPIAAKRGKERGT